ETRYDVVMAHSILHLLDDERAAIAKTYAILLPGGLFVSSTICLDDTLAWLKWLAPLGRRLNLLPKLRFFSADALEQSMRDAGFEIIDRWTPGKGKATFIIARKPGEGAQLASE